jgi:hypothetical protein
MWTVGMVLASIGASYVDFAKSAYWGLLQWLQPAPPPEKRKPPDPKQPVYSSRARLLLLSLQVALRIAHSQPDITLSYDKKMRHSLRSCIRRGHLKVAKLTQAQQDYIYKAVNKMPSDAGPLTDTKGVLLDSGASGSVTGCKGDFISGTLRKLPKPIPFDGIGGTTYGTHVGRVKYDVFDDRGDLVALEHDMLYGPGLKC